MAITIHVDTVIFSKPRPVCAALHHVLILVDLACAPRCIWVTLRVNSSLVSLTSTLGRFRLLSFSFTAELNLGNRAATSHYQSAMVLVE